MYESKEMNQYYCQMLYIYISYREEANPTEEVNL